MTDVMVASGAIKGLVNFSLLSLADNLEAFAGGVR